MASYPGQAPAGTAANGADRTPLDYALAYLRAGLSVIPVRRDGTKAPAVKEGKS